MFLGQTLASMGARIRAVRMRKRMTIPALSQLSGLSSGFLSQIETGKASPSLESLARIAEALGLCSADLFEAPPPVPRVIPKDGRPRLRRGNGPEIEYLAPVLAARNIQAAIVRLTEGGMAGGCDHAHVGEELMWVLAGSVRVIQGEYAEDMNEGDSVLVDGRVPHTYEVTGPADARLLIISSPPAEIPLSV